MDNTPQRPTREMIETAMRAARLVANPQWGWLANEIEALRADCKVLAELAMEWASFVTTLDEFSDEGSSYSPTYFPEVLANHRVSALRESQEVKAAIARHGSTTP